MVKGMCTNFINVYASCNSRSRRDMWSCIKRRKGLSGVEEWCIGGDFNTVAIEEERIGISTWVKRRDMEDFNNFMENMNLIDLPCMGNRFTWFIGNGTSMSRLDRIMLTDKLVLDWKLDNQFVEKRVLSDQCPMWLKGGGNA